MGKLGLLGMVVLVLWGVAACSAVKIGSGPVVTLEKPLSGFDRIEAAWGFDVQIRQGDTFAVLLRVSENLVDDLDVAVRQGTLHLGLRAALGVANAHLEAEVTLPALSGLEVSGGADARLESFRLDDPFTLGASGGAKLRGDVEAGSIRADVSGGAEVSLSGTGEDLELNVSGGGEADLPGLTVREATVEASGGGTATVHATDSLDAEATGGGRVYYKGNPSVDRVETSGGGQVRPM